MFNALKAEARINPSILKDSKLGELNQWYTNYLNNIKDDKRFIIEPKAKTVTFGAPVFQDLSPKEQAYLDKKTTDEARGIQDFTKAQPKQIFTAFKPYVNISEDLIVSKDDLVTATDIFRANGKVEALPERVKVSAKLAGVSEKAFVAAQRTARGMSPIDRPRIYQPSKAQLLSQYTGVPTQTGRTKNTADRNIQNEAQGFALLRQELPLRGAAYLASAISHESGWDGGMWGQVAGDGTNANGGLISWASWHNRPARLGKVMRYFNVSSMALVPEEDQLAYALVEMRQSYPKAYRILSNPNSSSRDLEYAIHHYFGFDKRYTGGRFTHAEALIRQNS